MLAAQVAEGLRAAYLRTLKQYLEKTDEAALAEAYQLARRALTQGCGLIDWAALHDDAVATLDLVGQGPELLSRAGQFFRESLAPFEMTQRGYVETNTWLERLNRDLRKEIREKEELEARLIDSNRELEAFSYSVAHDLRAPLRHIGGFSEILLEDHAAELGEEARHLLERIDRAAHRMFELIDGLLALSHAMRAEMKREPVDLVAQARAIVVGLREAEPNRKVTVDIQDPLPGDGDPRLLDDVLQNLIANAWKFTSKEPEGHIQIGMDDRRSPPVYFVRDNGAGFDMAHAGVLFGVFQRLHSTEDFPGTGIGLATVERIIRRHGGLIWAESSPGQGAVFRFTLGPEAPEARPPAK
jgi:light-regulated signal transduction histidine kinase (bacteriophytochrome)